MGRITHDLVFNFRRLIRLIGREGFVSAFRKGWPYLKWRALSEVRRYKILKSNTVEDRFTKIYLWNFWGAKESASGPGSGLLDTQQLRENLPELFRRFSVRTVFDAPCGDFHWMKLVMAETDIKYIGGDIVRPMIESNTAKYGNDRISFVHVDVTRDRLPAADLWFCRDLYYHLSRADIFKVLDRFVDSKMPYLLGAHLNSSGVSNIDIASGDYRPVNLFAPPFLLPRDVLFRISDCAAGATGALATREMCLWSHQQIVSSLDAAHQVAGQ